MNGKKILFVHFQDLNHGSGGSRRAFQNYSGCRERFSVDTFQTHFCSRKAFPDDVLEKHYYAITSEEHQRILAILASGDYSVVFLDNSLYGVLAEEIKKRFPGIVLISHYHNFEREYAFMELQHVNSAAGLAQVQSKILNEQLCSENSDYLVCISEEDRKNICRTYGISEEKTAVIPPALEDDYSADNAFHAEMPYVLFLGFSFFANDQAAEFLIDRIAPHVRPEIYIAGTGMKRRFPEEYENVRVFDYIESLNSVMNGASAFVSPVFSGSGSKIKIAEALMHGKYIIGTRQSFAGYEAEKTAHSVCETPDEFISEINRLDLDRRFYGGNRELFLRDHDMRINGRYYSFLADIISR